VLAEHRAHRVMRKGEGYTQFIRNGINKSALKYPLSSG
jgi:phage-related protein